MRTLDRQKRASLRGSFPVPRNGFPWRASESRTCAPPCYYKVTGRSGEVFTFLQRFSLPGPACAGDQGTSGCGETEEERRPAGRRGQNRIVGPGHCFELARDV